MSKTLRYRIARGPQYLCQRLEQRFLLAAVSWDGGGDGVNWKDPLNWSNDAIPGTGEDVTIDVPGSNTVLMRGAIPLFHSLVNRETLWLRGENLNGSANANLWGDVTNDGTIRLESIESNWICGLTVSGTITNNAGGDIEVNQGSGGNRNLLAATIVNNAGATIAVNPSSTGTRNVAGNIDNSGTISVGVNLTINGSSKTFNLFDGLVTTTGSGRFNWINGRMNCIGGAISGAVYAANNSTLYIDPSFPAQTIRVDGGCNLVSSIPQQMTIWVNGSSAFPGANLGIPTGATLTNAGTIRLESSASNVGSWIATGDPSSHLVNTSTGTIQAIGAAGGGRGIGVALDNYGLISTDTFLGCGTFNQISGSVVTSGPDGQVVWSGALNLIGGTIPTNSYLQNGSLSVGSAFGAQSIILNGTCNLLNNLSPGMMIWVQGRSAIENATLYAAVGAVNRGIIRLESIDGPYWSIISTNDVFTNAPTGVIYSKKGSLGNRYISGWVHNEGLIDSSDYYLRLYAYD